MTCNKFFIRKENKNHTTNVALYVPNNDLYYRLSRRILRHSLYTLHFRSLKTGCTISSFLRLIKNPKKDGPTG